MRTSRGRPIVGERGNAGFYKAVSRADVALVSRSIRPAVASVFDFCGNGVVHFLAGRYAPSGRLLVFDDKTVFGFSRKPQYFRWTTPLERQLFASSKARIIHHRGTEGEERTSKASSFPRITLGSNLTSCKFRLLYFPLCSLWLRGCSSGFVHYPGYRHAPATRSSSRRSTHTSSISFRKYSLP